MNDDTKEETMTTTIERDDPVRAATDQRVAAERAVEGIEGELKSFNVQPGRLAPTLRLLKLQEDLTDARTALSTAQAEETAVKRAARAEIIAARRVGRTALLVGLAVAAEAALAAADAISRHDEATAGLIQRLPGDPLPGAPLPALDAVREQLARLRRSLAPPAPKAPAPVPPGMVRLKLLTNLWHHDRLHCYTRGDILDLEESYAKELLKRKPPVAIAVEVA
ncbi:MAG: hypothetical protein HY729_05130 [Candidatus Rokubacteria bacterium]|nr:hypothetical protein [Candidatus Rokubacteria bacterium]